MTTAWTRIALTWMVCGLAAPAAAPAMAGPPLAATVEANDNRRPAGTIAGGTLTLALRASRGTWYPEGPTGPALTIEALGEVGRPLAAPAPLIRLPEGTALAVSVHNQLATPLRVHGLCARDGGACPPLEVPPGATRDVRFASGRAGTYHYWASAIGAPVPFREMAGAFVVDPAGAAAPPDRVLVITEWSNLTPAQLGRIMTADVAGEAFVAMQPSVSFMVNGLAWPATERLAYRVGDRARWRVVNLSSQPHPMHLHGFYFDVESEGTMTRDRIAAPGQAPHVVTHLLQSGATMTMAWTPERAGNWLFHCHLMAHVSPLRRLGDIHPGAADHHRHHDPGLGMAGLVMGVTVDGPEDPATPPADAPAPRRIALVMAPVASTAAADPSALPAAGFALHESDAPAAPSPTAPGPDLVLQRGQPVEIALENRLAEATSIHWHGMELDSYYDGVHGFSGRGPRQTPMIPAGGRFVVRFTPPRSGTFIYHTHLHDHRQLSSGLYGAMVVVAPGETFDPAVDHALVLGRSGIRSGVLALPDASTPVVLNGQQAPRFVWRAGARHRLRFVNITPDDIFEVSVRGVDTPLDWTPVAKDGAPVVAEARAARPASQVVAVGETYDFAVDLPPGRRTVWIEVRAAGGRWELQAQVVVR